LILFLQQLHLLSSCMEQKKRKIRLLDGIISMLRLDDGLPFSLGHISTCMLSNSTVVAFFVEKGQSTCMNVCMYVPVLSLHNVSQPSSTYNTGCWLCTY
jgi:hypothetical protein